MGGPGDPRLALGIDVGTSGVRGVALDAAGRLRASADEPLPPPQRRGARVTQDPMLWWHAVEAVLLRTLAALPREHVAAIAVDGTSGSVLLADAQGQALTEGWLYSDASCTAEAARIADVAPAGSLAGGVSSPLARLLHLLPQAPGAAHVLHQADWIAARLTGRPGWSDENNVLKLGYDPGRQGWPNWFGALGVPPSLLPAVLAPGTPIGPLQGALARRLGLREDVIVAAGTTDGVAAFLATGAGAPGDAVTSLGSTLVLKIVAEQPVGDRASGVYSHRLGAHWLPGGASNAGGASLLRHFELSRIVALTPRLEPERDTGLDYYPLPAVGERFPVADPSMPPRVAPRPDDDARFLQGLLEGLAGIEARGYERLAELGAPRPTRVYALGGGTRNPAWMRLRERRLGVPLAEPRHREAACGAARLAWRAIDPYADFA